MTDRLGILKRPTGRRIIAWAAATGLLAAALLMPQAMFLAQAAASPASLSQADDHAGHAGNHSHEEHHAQAPLSDMPDSPGCDMCSDCALCTMALPMTIGSLASPDYPPVRLRIAETNLLRGIVPPPPAEPPRV